MPRVPIASKVIFDADKVTASMKARSLKGVKRLEVQVGYEAPYAVYVHEDMEAYHEVGQAKYLSTPARKLGPQLGRLVRKHVEQKKGLENGLLAAGEMLLNASRELVPVDTGVLRDSGFVMLVREDGSVAKELRGEQQAQAGEQSQPSAGGPNGSS